MFLLVKQYSLSPCDIYATKRFLTLDTGLTSGPWQLLLVSQLLSVAPTVKGTMAKDAHRYHAQDRKYTINIFSIKFILLHKYMHIFL
jgi:hypothetical protein